MIAQVAIPIIPTIRVAVTFSKFEEYHGRAQKVKELNERGGGKEEDGDEFHTPTGSPERENDSDGKPSWFGWVKGRPRGVGGGEMEDDNLGVGEERGEGGGGERWVEDPFAIPDYLWLDMVERRRREKEKKRRARALAHVKNNKKKEGSWA